MNAMLMMYNQANVYRDGVAVATISGPLAQEIANIVMDYDAISEAVEVATNPDYSRDLENLIEDAESSQEHHSTLMKLLRNVEKGLWRNNIEDDDLYAEVEELGEAIEESFMVPLSGHEVDNLRRIGKSLAEARDLIRY